MKEKMAGFNRSAFRRDIEAVIETHMAAVAEDNHAGIRLFEEAVDAAVVGVLGYAMRRNDYVQLRASVWLRKNRTTVRKEGARVGVLGFQ